VGRDIDPKERKGRAPGAAGDGVSPLGLILPGSVPALTREGLVWGGSSACWKAEVRRHRGEHMYAIPAVMLVWGWGGGGHIRAPPPDSMAQQYQGTWKEYTPKLPKEGCITIASHSPIMDLLWHQTAA